MQDTYKCGNKTSQGQNIARTLLPKCHIVAKTYDNNDKTMKNGYDLRQDTVYLKAFAHHGYENKK